jgi:hypothetical protein
MKTVKTILAQMTDAHTLMQDVTETLRELDPTFSKEEATYLQAAATLVQETQNSVSPSASEYLAAMEQEFISNTIFASWLGFNLSLACFHDPKQAVLLKGDYVDLHQEDKMHTLPMAKNVLPTIRAFRNALPAHQSHLLDEIINYYAYLQTTVYKLSHYFGFCLADRFQVIVVPGYTSNHAIIEQYTKDLQDYLEFDIGRLT